MSALDLHGEWLSLLDISGPFLAEPVLKEALPQGLQGFDPIIRKELRQAYDEWREALDFEEADFPKLHGAWISFVLNRVLGYSANLLRTDPAVTDRYRFVVPESGVILKPDAVLTDGREDGRSFLLVTKYAADVSLDDVVKDDGWPASPVERTIEHCRATGTRLALITNGERWTFVDAPLGAVTSTASWYAKLWSQEALTLQAFSDLLGVRRFFGGTEGELTTLLDRSLTLQDEVTDALGEQVRRAVEVLVQSVDRADQDRNRELLKDVSPEELYEAGLTIMMRIVFLLSAEERGLLLLGDPQYETTYAVSTLRSQLRAQPEEVLERRWDAWSRLLAVFRAVFGGVEHPVMRMPALGGSLFDPDRFPFLEGRTRGSNWKTDPAVPLPIDNRTVLLLLDAVQLFQGRTLSYLALDVEQIGYVYEGLLERTVVRAKEVTLDLIATKNSKNPWVTLSELDDAATTGADAIEDLLKERTGSSGSRVRNDLAKNVDETQADKLLAACNGDVSLRDQLKCYFHVLRTDSWGYPLVYPKGTFIVASGSDRRETGTHYTPKSFTEAIVKTTLEPLVYAGPSEGEPREAWKLKPADHLLDLKICDPAMGSGAFLVQVCRYLSEKVVEAWADAERAGKAISAEGEVKNDLDGLERISPSLDERSLLARRLIAERCLYGVDMNPLAVELAKLSIWLITLSKGRPFGFLDHNLRCGDSLLGVTDLDQLYFLMLKPTQSSVKKLFASALEGPVKEAVALRLKLRSQPIRDITDVRRMEHLDNEARSKLKLPILLGDALMGSSLAHGLDSPTHSALLAAWVGDALANRENLVALEANAKKQLNGGLPEGKSMRRPFHWPLEYPEVFDRPKSGFDAFVGNPPFLGSQFISGVSGANYKSYLAETLSLSGKAATADIVVFFFLRAVSLIQQNGFIGFLARRSLAEGKNREIGIGRILNTGMTIYCAKTNLPWPGKASVVVHQVHLSKASWSGQIILNDQQVSVITSYLDATSVTAPKPLSENQGRMFQGTILNGEGFKLSDEQANQLLTTDQKYADVVFPFIGGNEVNSYARPTPACCVINFWDWSESRAATFDIAFSMLEHHVKPERQRKRPNGEFQLRRPLPQRWWQHGEKRPALYHAVGRGHYFEAHPEGWTHDCPLERVLVISRGVTKYPAFTFVPNRFIFSEKLYVLAADSPSVFSVLSSDIHIVWAWRQKTSMGADLFSLSYTHGDIFETFPFPEGILDAEDRDLNQIGQEFFHNRQTYMEQNGQGLTKFYNDFHDPTIDTSELERLRRLQTR